MVVGFKNTCTASAYHHKSCEFESREYVIKLVIALR